MMTMWALSGLVCIFCAQVWLLWFLIVRQKATHITPQKEAEGRAYAERLSECEKTFSTLAHSIAQLNAAIATQAENISAHDKALAAQAQSLKTQAQSHATIKALQHAHTDMNTRINNTDRGLRHIKRIFESHEHAHTRNRF